MRRSIEAGLLLVAWLSAACGACTEPSGDDARPDAGGSDGSCVEGARGFEQPEILVAGDPAIALYAATAAGFAGDDRIELAVGVWAPPSVRFVGSIRDGGALNPRPPLPLDRPARDLAAADFNSDGRAELVVLSSPAVVNTNAEIKVLQSEDGGAWIEVDTATSSFESTGLEIDGNRLLVLTSSGVETWLIGQSGELTRQGRIALSSPSRFAGFARTDDENFLVTLSDTELSLFRDEGASFVRTSSRATAGASWATIVDRNPTSFEVAVASSRPGDNAELRIYSAAGGILQSVSTSTVVGLIRALSAGNGSSASSQPKLVLATSCCLGSISWTENYTPRASYFGEALGAPHLFTVDWNGDGLEDLISVDQVLGGQAVLRLQLPVFRWTGSMTAVVPARASGVAISAKPTPQIASAHQLPETLTQYDWNGQMIEKTGERVVDGPAHAVTAVDLDDDDFDELIVGFRSDPRIGLFSRKDLVPPIYLSGFTGGAYDLKTLDLDADGRSDILVTLDSDTDSIRVLLNNADGTVSEKWKLTAGRGPSRSIAADVDGDGRLEVLTALFLDGGVAVLSNWQTGQPAEKIFLDAGGGGAGTIDLAVLELDGDARLDIVAINHQTAELVLFRQTERLVFSSGTHIPLELFATRPTSSMKPRRILVEASLGCDSEGRAVVLVEDDGVLRFDFRQAPAFIGRLEAPLGTVDLARGDLDGDFLPELVAVSPDGFLTVIPGKE